MQIVDTAASHRAIVLKADNKLDSSTIISALVAKGMSSKRAIESTGNLMDALEEYIISQRIVAA